MPTPYDQVIVRNPLQSTIDDAERIIGQLLEVSEILESAIADERLWHGHYRDALDNYEMAETEALANNIILAQVKEGPLAGLATSSEAYKIALSRLKNDLRKGSLAELWKTVDRIKRSYEASAVELEQHQTRFSALRKVCELKANVLRASTI